VTVPPRADGQLPSIADIARAVFNGVKYPIILLPTPEVGADGVRHLVEVDTWGT
jgi:hypothetical protein